MACAEIGNYANLAQQLGARINEESNSLSMGGLTISREDLHDLGGGNLRGLMQGQREALAYAEKKFTEELRRRHFVAAMQDPEALPMPDPFAVQQVTMEGRYPAARLEEEIRRHEMIQLSRDRELIDRVERLRRSLSSKDGARINGNVQEAPWIKDLRTDVESWLEGALTW